MHTSEPQWITFESSIHTLPGCDKNITEDGKKEEPKKIYVNMTKEQHEKMYKMFMAKKMANQRRQMAKRHFKQQVGEIRGQYVDSTVINELKEHRNDDNEHYQKKLDQSENIFDKEMTMRDVIELFMMSHKSSQLNEMDFTNILPSSTKDLKCNYYISYFVACLKNGKTELLPFIVKIHKNGVMMKVPITKKKSNEVIDKDCEKPINSTGTITAGSYSIQIKIPILETIFSKPIDKVSKNINYCTCDQILMKVRTYKSMINENYRTIKNGISTFDENLFQQICENLVLYKKEKEQIKGELFPMIEDILCNSYEETYSCVDTELIYHFYRLYLEMYGTDNIDSIDFIWNCGEEKKSSNSFYLPKMKIMHDEIRPEDFQEDSDKPISKHSIDDFCFTLNEIYDFKENFPYKFENSLLYSFDKNVEINTIIPFFSEYKKFNQMKNVFKEKMSVGCVKEGGIKSLSSLDILLNDNPNLLEKEKGDKICERALDNIYNLKVNDSIKRGDLQVTSKVNVKQNETKKLFHSYSEEEIAKNMEMYYDLDHNYASYPIDDKGGYKSFEYTMDSYIHATFPQHDAETMKLFMRDDIPKDLENITNEMIINVYDRNRHMSILCQVKLPISLIQMLENHFDVWFGNSFELMKMKSKSEFEKKHHSVNLMTLLYQNFHMKPYMNRESIKEEWKAFEKMYMSSVDYKGKEESTQIRLSIFDYVSILKNHFTIDDDVNHRIRSTELNNMFVEVLTKELVKKGCQIDEDYFITNFTDVVKELGLKKKRYASGNFYFGIVRKNTEPSS